MTWEARNEIGDNSCQGYLDKQVDDQSLSVREWNGVWVKSKCGGMELYMEVIGGKNTSSA